MRFALLVRHVTVLGVVGALAGCAEDESKLPTKTVRGTASVSSNLLAQTWPVRMANDEARAAFEGKGGWRQLFIRDYAQSLSEFSRSGNRVGQARVHMELAAVYRQGAVLAANATHHVYGDDRTETDPVELQYLVGVSRAIRGDAEAALAAFADVPSGASVTARSAAWSTWLSDNPSWPPALEWLDGMSGAMGPVTVGGMPNTPSLPHFEFTERSKQRAMVKANDPTVLLALSEWHLAAARAADAEVMSILPLLMSPWRLPSEPAPVGADDAPAQISDAWLFARTLLCSEDVLFMAAVEADGGAAISQWSDRSPLAAAIAPAWDGDRLDYQKVLDQSVLVMKQAQAAMVETSGTEAGYHRPFAMFVRLGVLQAGMVVADKAGQYRDAGILRLEALERMEGGKGSIQRDPAFAMSVAAWDAGNRSVLRPEDILHNLLPDYPALTVARPPLEALHLRLNRRAPPSTPVH